MNEFRYALIRSHLSEGSLAEDLQEAELVEADLLAAALSVDQFLQGGFTWIKRMGFHLLC